MGFVTPSATASTCKTVEQAVWNGCFVAVSVAASQNGANARALPRPVRGMRHLRENRVTLLVSEKKACYAQGVNDVYLERVLLKTIVYMGIGWYSSSRRAL